MNLVTTMGLLMELVLILQEMGTYLNLKIIQLGLMKI